MHELPLDIYRCIEVENDVLGWLCVKPSPNRQLNDETASEIIEVECTLYISGFCKKYVRSRSNLLECTIFPVHVGSKQG